MAASSKTESYDEAEFVPKRDDDAMMDLTDHRFVKSFQQCVCESVKTGVPAALLIKDIP